MTETLSLVRNNIKKRDRQANLNRTGRKRKAYMYIYYIYIYIYIYTYYLLSIIYICYICPNPTVSHLSALCQVWYSAIKYEEGGTGCDLQGGFHASQPAGLLAPHAPFLEVQWNGLKHPAGGYQFRTVSSFLWLEERLTSKYPAGKTLCSLCLDIYIIYIYIYIPYSGDIPKFRIFFVFIWWVFL